MRLPASLLLLAHAVLLHPRLRAAAAKRASARQACAETAIGQFKLAATSHQQGALDDAGLLYEQLLWLPGV